MLVVEGGRTAGAKSKKPPVRADLALQLVSVKSFLIT